MNEFLPILVPLLIGVAATWFFSWMYYVHAGKELRHEAAEPRKLTLLMLRAMENKGWVEWSRDSFGNPIGFVFTDTGGATMKASAWART